jgi:hypothetical protein
MEQQLKTLHTFMQANGKNLSYNEALKAQFKKLSTSFLRALAKQLPFTEKKVSFNAGGIAVSGDAHLMGMFNNGIGLYITINEANFSCDSMNFLYRTIKDMKDYSGGPNNYMTDAVVQENRVLERIKQLCNVA